MDQRTELAALRIAANKLLQACEVVPNGSLSAEFVRETFKDSLPEAAQALQAAPEGGDDAAALAEFTEYFVKNYPGPNTIIGNPNWHAPKIFRAAQYAIRANAAAPSPSAALQAGEV